MLVLPGMLQVTFMLNVFQSVASPNIIGSTAKSLVAGSSAKPPVSDSPMLAFTSKPVADTDDPKVTQPFSYTVSTK